MFRKPRSDKGQKRNKRSFKNHVQNLAKGTWNAASVAGTAAVAPVLLYGIHKPKKIGEIIGKYGGDNRAKTFYEDLKLQSLIGAGVGAASLPFTLRNQYKKDKYSQNNNPRVR